QGQIIASCSPSQALKELAGSIWEAILTREQLDVVKASCKLISSQMYNGMLRVRVVSPRERPGEAFNQAIPTIEDFYFNLVSQS
ncbi:MAG TPA: hypothetical protein VN843_08940, partial [Anaerolineales bacterium]|nr:hypothetical protein [Anaerolineales bacterium]